MHNTVKRVLVGLAVLALPASTLFARHFNSQESPPVEQSPAPVSQTPEPQQVAVEAEQRAGPPTPALDPPRSVAATVVFCLMFLIYMAQLYWVARKLFPKQDWFASSRASPTEPSSASSDETWIYFSLSVLIPVLVSFVPDAFNARTAGLGLAFSMGIDFVTAFLVTVITLEISLQVQTRQAGMRDHPWAGLLAVNLGLDIVSLIALQVGKKPLTDSGDPFLFASFVVFSLPTVVTSSVVVSETFRVFMAEGHRRG